MWCERCRRFPSFCKKRKEQEENYRPISCSGKEHEPCYILDFVSLLKLHLSYQEEAHPSAIWLKETEDRWENMEYNYFYLLLLHSNSSNCWSIWKMVTFWVGRGGRWGILDVIVWSPWVRVWCLLRTAWIGGSAATITMPSLFTIAGTSVLFLKLSPYPYLSSCELPSFKTIQDETNWIHSVQSK